MELNENAMNAILLLVIVWYLGMVIMVIKYGGQLDSYCKENVYTNRIFGCMLHQQEVVTENIE